MARDRLVMGFALLALTASLTWLGNKLPFEPVRLPSLVTMSVGDGSFGGTSGTEVSTVAPKVHVVRRHKHCRSWPKNVGQTPAESRITSTPQI